MEPWEALDVDDSDLPSLLRPCKRRHHHDHTPQQSQQHSHHSLSQLPNSTANPSPNPLQSQPQINPPQTSTGHPNSIFPRIIPGPAGAVQAAMLRKARAAANGGGEDPIVPTQEYIRRAVEEGEDDDDFQRNPWLCGLEFVATKGMVDCEFPVTPLSSIKKCPEIGRVDQIVAVIKSCTPNGLGDLMVTLKDPTTAIDASIHHKVLAEVEFGKEISVGSVLILQKVAVFAPSQSTRFLNITLSNVVKVISKDCGPPLKQNHFVSSFKPVVLGTECDKETGNMSKDFSLEVDKTEGMINDSRQYGNVGVTGPNYIHMEIENPLPQRGHCRDQNDIMASKEPLVRKDAATEILKKAIRNPCERGSVDVNNLVGSQNDGEVSGENGVQKQTQPLLMSRAPLPEWTDEQLNELFGADCEDVGSLF